MEPIEDQDQEQYSEYPVDLSNIPIGQLRQTPTLDDVPNETASASILN